MKTKTRLTYRTEKYFDPMYIKLQQLENAIEDGKLINAQDSAVVKVIDYLIEQGGLYSCSNCAFSNTQYMNFETGECEKYEGQNNVACRNGLIEYFTKKLLKENFYEKNNT